VLVLEIEYLLGSVAAACSNDDARLDWPPQPDRVFSALVASWGARGNNPDERAALEWLECQESPHVIASDVSVRSVPTVFVPPNDFKTSTSNLDVIPARRQRQGRRFPRGYPEENVVRIAWSSVPEPKTLHFLDALARDTSYLGHSISLTRCRFVNTDIDLSKSRPAVRAVYRGRLQELERAFQAGRRPSPGAIVVPKRRETAARVVSSIFSSDWLILADLGGYAPALVAAPTVMRVIRDILISGYQNAVGDPPEWLSGHGINGRPSQEPHLAVIPLVDIGWSYSQGRLMGCAIVLPRSIEADDAVLHDLELSVRNLIQRCDTRCTDVEEEDPYIPVHYGREHPWSLQPMRSASKSSLRSERWTGLGRSNFGGSRERAARVWTTATPIVLDRYPKKSDIDARAVEFQECIVAACRNIGLPIPSHVCIEMGPRLRGAPPARIPKNTPSWQCWRLPRPLEGRYLTHATVRFDEPIRGPVILGAGRYVGMGLCLPLEDGAEL
jgi:CRISPR-associated protein Csb2